MEKKWAVRLRWGVLLITVIITIISIILFSKGIGKEVQKQAEVSLKDVATQNVITVEKELNEGQKFLFGMAKELQNHDGDTVEEMLQLFRPYVEEYDLKRMGFIDNDGTAYVTDGYIQDLSFREFFKKGMQGEAIITGVMEDKLSGGENINVFSVPVYHKNTGKIEGVLFATYKTQTLEKLLNVESFGGKGYGIVVNSNGNIIADSEKSPNYGDENWFDSLKQAGREEGKNEIQKMQNAMKANKTGVANVLGRTNEYVYYTPIDNKMDEESWYMLTIVPEKVLESRVDSLVNRVIILVTVIVLILILATVVYFISHQNSQKILMKLAYEDALTGGDNYACFVKRMKNRNQGEQSGFLVAMDLSEFKIINSTCGVSKGDETLQAVWRVVDNNLNRHELAAHINADHFVLYLLATDKEEVGKRIDKLTKDVMAISEYLQIPDLATYYGVYEIQEADEVESSYNKANQAKRFVKGNHKINFAFHEEVNYEQVLENKRLADGFEEAIQKHRFEVWYQPKYSTDDAVPVGAEALVRWRDKDGTLIPPFKFIPLFEKNGMIAKLDEYVFEEVCRQQKKWQREGKDILPVSVNISRASLYYSSIVEKYVKIVESYNIPIEYVQLEITESATIENAEVKELVERFQDAGFRLLLDDFGNGYSSLATLNTLHFDVLKVDKSLIDYIGNSDGEKLLICIIELAKSLGLCTTAEGVESAEQVKFLKNLRCNDIQGYYFSKPLPMVEYESML